MRVASTVICLCVVPIVVSGQAPPLRGIEVSDLNTGVNACSDFYEFANGGWRASHPMPPTMSLWSRRWEAGESTRGLLNSILVETAAKPSQPQGSTDQLIGDFYGACMDVTSINRLGAKPIQPLLAAIDSVTSPADLQRMIRHLHGIGVAAPFGLFGESDNHNPTQVIAQVVASGLGMPDRDYYLKPEARFKEAREKYRLHVASMFGLTGYPPAQARAAAEVVFGIETALASASLDNVALRDPRATDHKTTFTALQSLTPNFDWTAYYRESGIPVGDLNVSEPRFLEEFNRLMAATPVADWKSYLKWQVINTAAASLSDDFVQADFAFYATYLGGEKEMKPRSTRCTQTTDGFLGEAVGRKYVERHFSPEAKQRVQDMVKNLLAAMGETIRGLEWMSPETKQRALEKLATFNPKIGYPDVWKDYGSLRIGRESYWDDVVAASRFQRQDNLSTIGKPVDRGRWGMTPSTSNAYYNATQNEIVFPAGILQPPAFNMQANDAVNYGAIGVVIGHEISHGFDDEGAQYDALGRLHNWWTDQDLKTFQAKTRCVAKQFDGYFVEPGLHHNGQLVLGESIGDLAGARIAYRAFQLSQRGKPPLPTIDGYTPEQQFFIAWGQFRGDVVRPERARTMVQGDPHPIGKFRVIGPLSNLPEFRSAFACPEGSPMVRPPDERCDVW